MDVPFGEIRTPSFRMKIDAIRKIVAIQAIEQCDNEGEILSDSDLREAAAIAGAPLPKSPGDSEIDSFFSERAELLSIRALTKFPKPAQWIEERSGGHRFGLLALGLIAVASVLGFLSNELGPDDKINILSFPLLGILAWSLLISIREVFLFFRSRASMSEGEVAWLRPLLSTDRGSGAGENEGGDESSSWEAAKSLYFRRWTSLTMPRLFAKVKILFHTVALALAVSAIAGMYLKGLANEYRAVWESTFFEDGEALRPFLSGVLGPAAALLGDEIPSTESLDRIHWKADEGEVVGENAAQWIHWYAITLFLFVILPRGFFILVWQWKDHRFRRTIRYRSVSPGYYEHLIAISSGTSREFTLIPYGLELGDGERRAIERGLETHLEGPVALTFENPVAFGEEEDLPEFVSDHSETALVPLLNFASTPEKETHLALVQSLEEKSTSPLPFLLLDATDFDRKSEGLGDAKQRREDRENAWRYLLSEKPLELVIVSALPPTTTAHGEV